MEIKERMNDFFTLTQALAYCKRKRHPIKKAGLYLAALKYGFIEGTVPHTCSTRPGWTSGWRPPRESRPGGGSV